MKSPALTLLLAAALATAPRAACAPTKTLPLASAEGLILHHAQAASVTFKGRPAIELTAGGGGAASAPTARKAGPKGGKQKGGPGAREAERLDHLALIEGVEFSSGTIEVELAGEPGAGAGGGARGFVGVAFRVQPDRRTYDCFYLRPTNGRADDQERRNHTAQYISHPEHPWYVLREKTPSRYESYVDIVPAEWIQVRIEVDGAKARLHVNGHEQPTLIVNDVKSGGAARGAVALWFEGSTIARYRNLRITPR